MTHTASSPPAPAPLAQRITPAAPRWAVLGVAFGLLSATAIALWGPIGVSGTYPRFVGSILRQTSPDYAASNPYLVRMGTLVTPETMLVLGLLVGGFLAARLGRTRAPALENVHAAETTSTRRYLDAFVGGLLIVFGARLAGGCTSGHIISGMAQLAVSSTIFAAAVFASGMGTARLLKAWRN